MIVALPEGCPHIVWQWEHPEWDGPAETVSDEDRARRGRVVGPLYATWLVAPGGESAELPLREQEIAAQGLAMVGEPHRCQTHADTGAELWVVELTAE